MPLKPLWQLAEEWEKSAAFETNEGYECCLRHSARKLKAALRAWDTELQNPASNFPPPQIREYLLGVPTQQASEGTQGKEQERV